MRVAVAWINFSLYYDMFEDVLKRKVKLQVIVNSDFISKKFTKEIEYLENLGMELKYLKMPNGRRYMHHKF